MENILMFVSIVVIVFGVLQIILFFKLWGMTNNISEMKNIMELFMKKDFQNSDNHNLKENISPVSEIYSHNTTNNIKLDEKEFPSNVKFENGDIVIYKPENTKLIIIGFQSPNVFKCKTTDGSPKIYYFQEEYLDKC